MRLNTFNINVQSVLNNFIHLDIGDKVNNNLTHLSIEVLLALCGRCLDTKNSKLRHRIHRLSVIKFVEMLKHNQLKFSRFQMLILPPLIPLKGERLIFISKH